MKRTEFFVVLLFIVSTFIIPGAMEATSYRAQDVIKDRGGDRIVFEKQGDESCLGWLRLGARGSGALYADVSQETPRTGRLSVKTDPKDARVRILNIRPKFYQGMELEPGPHHVEVSAAGYETKKRWIKLGVGEHRHLNIRLVKLQTADVVAPRGKVFTNSMGMKFVYIVPGTFIMGSPTDETGRADNEEQHRVTLTQGFYMGVTEVTQGQWRQVMGNNLSHFKNCGEDCPVESVSWDDCQEFIGRLNRKEKTNKYRLPTEAEWEYACRAGSKTALYTGKMKVLGYNNAPALDEIAWYGGNSCVDYAGKTKCVRWLERQYPCYGCGTHPVGEKKPNAWGLHDMLGNVWEWCQDWYGKYPSGHVSDPIGPSSGTDRICRGGSWDSPAVGCRVTTRDDNWTDEGDYIIGFRLVRTP